MPKLNAHRVEQLQSGKVVLYTGDKKGSGALCRFCGMTYNKSAIIDFYQCDYCGMYN